MAETVRTVDPSVLISKLLDGAPGDDFDLMHWTPDGEKVKTRVRLQFQREEENLQLLAEAQQAAKDRGELQGYGDIYKEEQVVQLLQRAVRRVEKHQRPDGTSFYPHVWTDAGQLRASIGEPTMAVLVNCYELVKAKYGATEELEEKEAETWIARLSDPLRGPFFLSQLDSRHWPALIWLLAGTARDLCQRLGLSLPSSDDSSGSDQGSSTLRTGSSGGLPVASSTDVPDLEIPNDRIITRDEARELVKHAKDDEPKSE